MFTWLQTHNPSNTVFFLQETHSSVDHEQTWRSEWGSDMFYSHGTTESKGVVIMFPKQLDVTVSQQINDDHGRYILLDCLIDSSRFILVNVYAPTKNHVTEQCHFLTSLQEALEPFSGENLIVGGDFNTILNPVLDKQGGRQEPVSRYITNMIEFQEDFQLVDIWRERNPTCKLFTFHTRGGEFIQSRIDIWLVSAFLTPFVKQCQIKPSIKTDHSMITLDMQGEMWNQRGPGFWKFNSTLLHDQTYVDQVKLVLQNSAAKYNTLLDKGLIWDTVKCEIRGTTINYSKRKSVLEKQKFAALKKKQDALTLLLNCGDASDQVKFDLNKVMTELEEINDKQTKSAMIRSKVTWTEHGERSSKYFLGLEKRNYKNKCITTLQTDDGKVVTAPKDILALEKTFYENLYASQITFSDVNTREFVNNPAIPKLSQDEQATCEGTVSHAECISALKQFKNNKSPGTDGFTSEFYQFFWTDIKDLVLSSINYAFTSGNLSIDQKRGVISLIPKKDKDRMFLKN